MTQQQPGLLGRIGTVDPAPPWNLTTALFTVLAAVAAMLAASAFVATWSGTQPAALLLGWSLGGVVIIVFVNRARRREADRAAMRLAPPTTPLIILLLLSLGIAIGIDLLMLAATSDFLPAPELIGLAQQPTWVTWLLGIAFMIMIQPTAEELVFRGVAFPALRTALGAWPGLLASGAASGLFHLVLYQPLYVGASQNTMLWYGFVEPLLMGVWLALVRAATRSTRAAIAAHSAFGLFALLKLILLTG